MKYAVYNFTKIEDIPKNVNALHLVRPISKKKIMKILNECNEIKKITMSESTMKRMKKSINMLKEKNIELRLESNRGRAIEVPLEKLRDAIEMRKDLRPLREIEETLHIPKSTIHYLIKYAKRNKIKARNKVVYLSD